MKTPQIVTTPVITIKTEDAERRQMLLPEDTDGTIYMEDSTIEPGGKVGLHVHTREDEIFMVHEGEITFTIATQQHVVKAGGVVYGPAGVAHGLSFSGTEKTRFTTICTPGANFKAFSDEFRQLSNEATLEEKNVFAAKYGITLLEE